MLPQKLWEQKSFYAGRRIAPALRAAPPTVPAPPVKGLGKVKTVVVEKEVQTGKTKGLHVENALVLSSGGKKCGCPLKILSLQELCQNEPRTQILNVFS
ncbi:hypothetical protein H5410_002095 [Solanum commersonii]|uniref:Uncharacterized protein n=1 Tax=Solanum commersonii TaxID=4109 RepID=A0A9J6B1D0_SOLCO|nr:hypothetical protein H5410_002095 [Solanum commersonii]